MDNVTKYNMSTNIISLIATCSRFLLEIIKLYTGYTEECIYLFPINIHSQFLYQSKYLTFFDINKGFGHYKAHSTVFKMFLIMYCTVYLLSRDGSFARNRCPVIVVSMMSNKSVNYALRIHRTNVSAICYVHSHVGSDSQSYKGNGTIIYFSCSTVLLTFIIQIV